MKNYYRPKFDEEVIKEIIVYLKDQGIDVWFDQGSLLGLVRDGKFIEWDTDVDLGALDISLEKKLAIARYFYKRYGSAFYSQANNSIKTSFLDIKANIVWQIDLAFYTSRAEHLEKNWLAKSNSTAIVFFLYLAEIFGGSRIRTRKITSRLVGHLFSSVYSQTLASWLYKRVSKKIEYISVSAEKSYFQPLQKNAFLGASIPNDPQGYLALKYGEQWHIPQKTWDYLAEDGGINTTEL